MQTNALEGKKAGSSSSTGKAAATSNRREFLRQQVVLAGGLPVAAVEGKKTFSLPSASQDLPWYRRTFRWGQTNINEKDPVQYDIPWWREYWKETRVQGVIINAGGIVAYYPSRNPLQHRAEFLGDRDLFGELIEAARQDGLVVLARMDSNRAHEPFYRAHPGWFAADSGGKPYRAGELYLSCISSPYYEEYIPEVLREISKRYRPEGFTDNSWSGLGRDSICYCEYCARRFRDAGGGPLPARKDWDDSNYRKWIQWSYRRRLEVWDLFNRVTRDTGGSHCLWIGMIGGDMASQARSFRDYREICRRAEIIMFDDQGRNNSDGFQSNGEMGKRIHGLLGWEKLIPESMAGYQRNPTFRKAASPASETRMWMIEAFAGGIQPWWHHVGAYQEDRRQFRTFTPICRWYEANQAYLVDRKPVAGVGLVWSQQNLDFFGRDQAEELVIQPYRGMNQALIRARIPYLPVHVDDIERDAAGFSLLILPNLAALSDAQAAAVRRFYQGGGNLILTGEVSRYDEWGRRRPDFALADLMRVHVGADRRGPVDASRTDHSYLRLLPDLGADGYGPRAGSEPPASAPRHAVLSGFEQTNILPFGGRLELVSVESGVQVPATYIPDFPIYPPETSWMREPRTDFPAITLVEADHRRVVYLAADLDRRLALYNLPDHGRLLANLVRWAAHDRFPLTVAGPGLIDCHLYRQPGRLILHLINLTNCAAWRAPVYELIPVGPLEVDVRLPKGVRARRVTGLVSGKTLTSESGDEWLRCRVESVLDHEVLVLE